MRADFMLALLCQFAFLPAAIAVEVEPSAEEVVPYIDAERLASLVERAHLAADALAGREGNWGEWLGALQEMYIPSPPLPDSRVERTNRGVKEAALSLLLLRNRAVALGLLPAETLREVQWPAWIGEPLAYPVSAEIATARFEWIAPLVYELTGKLCKAAATRIHDDLICSVE